MGNEFHFLFFAMIFLSAPPCVLVLAVLGRRSLWSVCTYAEKNRAENALWKKFAPIWAKLKVQEKEILLYSALVEIAQGLWLTVQLFLPTRQVLILILYWNYL